MTDPFTKGEWWISKYSIFEMNEKQVAEILKTTDVIMVPVGSTEQHGPINPLADDSLAAWITTKWAGYKAETPHTPLVWTGYSPHHMRPPMQGAGTVTLRAETFKNLLYDIGRSLIHHGFNKIVYVTGHTSNIKVIEPALRSLHYETGAMAVMFRADAEFTPLVPKLRNEILENPPEDNPGWHAGETESSCVLLYRKEAFIADKAGEAHVLCHAPRWLPEEFTKKDGNPYVIYKGQDSMVMLPMEHHEYNDTGVIGNPANASAEKGRKIYEVLSDMLADFVTTLNKVSVEIKPGQREFTNRV